MIFLYDIFRQKGEFSMASFFSDLGKTFQSAAKTIQKKTAEGMEATRRNSELRSLREEQKKLFATLGEP